MYDPHKHHRRSIRLKGYDYSQAGAYFVTICIQNGAMLLGEVVDGEFRPNAFGLMVLACWESLPDRFPSIELDHFCLMPNHIHFILILTEANADQRPILGDIVGAFKSMTTNDYIDGVKNNGWPPFNKRVWQRNFYEHIVRNERALNAIRDYIAGNPAAWAQDVLHPDAPPSKFNAKWNDKL